MNINMITKHQIQNIICQSLIQLNCIDAIWISGSEAFGRSDEWSDIDIRILADLTHSDKIFVEAETALTNLSFIEKSYLVPGNLYPNHRQHFYWLKDSSPYHIIDLVIMNDDMLQSALEMNRHGDPVIILDRYHKIKPYEGNDNLRASFRARIQDISSSFPILSKILVERAMVRGKFAESIWFYHTRILAPLVEVLRAKYCPMRQDFGVRYLQWDLPEDVCRIIDELYAVSNLADLKARLEKAEKLFYETIKWLQEN